MILILKVFCKKIKSRNVTACGGERNMCDIYVINGWELAT